MPTNTIGFLTHEETMLLSDFLSKDKSIKWKLLYNPSKGMDTLKHCVDLCYNTASIVVLIETIKGCEFGGYTSVGWETPTHTGNMIYYY